MTVHLQCKGGSDWRVKKQSHISISKAPGALFRKISVPDFKISQSDEHFDADVNIKMFDFLG